VVAQAQFGTLAVRRGFVTQDQLSVCLHDQKQTTGVMIGQIMMRRGLLSTEQFLEVLRLQERCRQVCGSCGGAYMIEDGGRSCPRCGSALMRATPLPNGGIPSVLAHYEIIELIGRGGMGSVYRARDTRLNREVALKVLRDADFASTTVVARFVQEARLAARLAHPHIVAVHDAGQADGFHYFAMQHVRGRTLDALLRDRVLDRPTALALIEKVARALHHAHERGVIHRDVKPGNIIVDGAGEPHIVDFGLSKARDAAALTRTGAAMGSPSYMAPEQVRGDHVATSERTDVYALGVILYEALTGRMPHDAASVLDVYCRIIMAEPVRPRVIDRTIPHDLEAVCLKAMEKDPGRRYRTAWELAEELKRWRAGEPVRAKPITTMRMTMRRVRRHRSILGWMALGAGVAVAVLEAVRHLL